jgi:membrane protease YdiL (CAAX protease family)
VRTRSQARDEPSIAAGNRPAAVAPAWHTVLLVLVIAASSVTQSGAQQGSVAALAVAEVALVGYVAGGLWLLGHRLRELCGRWSPLDLVYGLLAAGAMLALWTFAQHLWPATAASPKTGALWLLVAAVVAVSEELVFRGYLQRQFEAWGLGFALSALAQAVVFAAAHANQGLPVAVGIGLCGLLLAGLVRARGGLAAAMVAHFAYDACVAFWT